MGTVHGKNTRSPYISLFFGAVCDNLHSMKESSSSNFIRILAGWTLLAIAAGPASAATNAWTGGAGNANWFADANWSAGHAPAEGEDAAIENTATVVSLNSSTPALASFRLANATLLFTNWPTVLNAGRIEIAAGGTATLAAAFANATVSNRIALACTDLVVAASGLITADGRGFAAASGPGASATVGTTTSAGAGHGGPGGIASSGSAGGAEYGSATNPVTPGSGAGNTTSRTGGSGGGVIQINASNRITVHGILSANGNPGVYYDGRHSGGGAGGSILLACDAIEGAGLIRANGGDAAFSAGNASGGGSGGRIAVHYTPASQAALGRPALRFTADPGATHTFQEPWKRADWGTIYLADTNGIFHFTQTAENFRGHLAIPGGLGAWAAASVSLTNACLGFLEENFSFQFSGPATLGTNAGLLGRRPLSFFCAALTNLGVMRLASNAVVAMPGGLMVSNGLFSMRGGSALGLGGNWLLTGTGGVAALENLTASITGNVTITSGSVMRVFSGPTNGAASNWGARVTVAGDLRTEPGAWIVPYAEPLDGGAPLFQCANLWVETGSGFDADGRGFARSEGPGAGTDAGTAPGGGGAHGGRGGDASSWVIGGQPYGDRYLPIRPGSGGGNTTSANGGPGGGVIRIQAAGRIQINGVLTANGTAGGSFAGREGGGGAGGSILLIGQTFTGTNGSITANGGMAYANATNTGAGGGGGGRIALYYDAAAQAGVPRPTVRFSAHPGAMYQNVRPWLMSDWGTICFPDATRVFQVSETMSGISGHVVITGGLDTFSVAGLDLSDAWLGFESNGVAWVVAGPLTIRTNAGLIGRAPLSLSCATWTNQGLVRLGSNATLSVAGDLMISNGGYSVQEGSTLSVGRNWTLAGASGWVAAEGLDASVSGSLVVQTNSVFAMFGASTNGPGAPWGARVACGQDIILEPGGWIHAYSHATNGGSPLFQCRNLLVA
jgi:hypothetical protein